MEKSRRGDWTTTRRVVTGLLPPSKRRVGLAQAIVHEPPIDAPTRLASLLPQYRSRIGRGGSRGTGVTDRDPSDGAGRGRGGYRTGRTDSDPRDAPGQGRW